MVWRTAEHILISWPVQAWLKLWRKDGRDRHSYSKCCTCTSICCAAKNEKKTLQCEMLMIILLLSVQITEIKDIICLYSTVQWHQAMTVTWHSVHCAQLQLIITVSLNIPMWIIMKHSSHRARLVILWWLVCVVVVCCSWCSSNVESFWVSRKLMMLHRK